MPSLPTVEIVSWKDATQCWHINQQDYDASYHILWEERSRYEGMRHKHDAPVPAPVAPDVPDVPDAPPARARRGRPPRTFEAFAPSRFVEKPEGSVFLDPADEDEAL